MKRLRHPVRAIREPFGTAGLVVACVALIAALGGTALAAKGALTGKQKKEVEKIAKKYAGKPGAPGANGKDGTNGSNGANGKDGTNGTSGTNGKDGKSVELEPADEFHCNELGGTIVKVEGEGGEGEEVCNGEEGEPGPEGPEGNPWTELGVLPPEQTEKGTWSFFGTEADGEFMLAPVSFPIPLGAILDFEHVHFQEDADFGSFCEGTEANPKANPGEFCVYSNLSGEVNALFNAEFKGVWRSVQIVGTDEEQAAGRTGAILRFAFDGESGERAHGFGSWAVTAPAP